jgi:hypothetical protein
MLKKLNAEFRRFIKFPNYNKLAFNKFQLLGDDRLFYRNLKNSFSTQKESKEVKEENNEKKEELKVNKEIKEDDLKNQTDPSTNESEMKAGSTEDKKDSQAQTNTKPNFWNSFKTLLFGKEASAKKAKSTKPK